MGIYSHYDQNIPTANVGQLTWTFVATQFTIAMSRAPSGRTADTCAFLDANGAMQLYEALDEFLQQQDGGDDDD